MSYQTSHRVQPTAQSNTSTPRLSPIEGRRLTTRRFGLTARHTRTTVDSSTMLTQTKQLKILKARLTEVERELQKACGICISMVRENDYFSTALHMLDKKNDELRQEKERAEYRHGLLLLHLRNRDDLIGTLSHKLNLMEDRMSEMLQNDERATMHDQSITCNLCCETVPLFHLTWCTNPETPHPICHDCISRTMRMRNSNPCTDHAEPISCLSMHEECTYEMSTVCDTSEGRKFMEDKSFIASMARVCDMIRSSSPDNMDALMFRLAYMQADGTFRGFQCTKCKHGPLWNDFCDDLVSHHDQEQSKGVFVNNACPKCATMVANASEMTRWDGDMNEE